jgi:uncharacterized protein (TIGR02246 family)
MRWTRPLALAALLTSACVPDRGPVSFGDEERAAVAAEARAASVALLDALNAHDADAILAFYDLDGDFTYVACTNFMFGGRGYVNLTRSLHANYEESRYDMAVQSVRVLGPDVAVVSLQGTFLAPLFVTRVLRRSAEGRWLVTWEHESWPGCADPVRMHPGAGGEMPPAEPTP